MDLGPYLGFLWGFFGSLAGQFIGLTRIYREDPGKIPDWASSLTSLLFVIFVTLTIGAIGGVLVVGYIQSNHKLSPILAMNIGASAPLFFSSIGNRIPPVEPGEKID